MQKALTAAEWQHVTRSRLLPRCSNSHRYTTRTLAGVRVAAKRSSGKGGGLLLLLFLRLACNSNAEYSKPFGNNLPHSSFISHFSVDRKPPFSGYIMLHLGIEKSDEHNLHFT